MDQLVNLAMLLLLGTLCSALAYQLRMPSTFFLLLAGMVFGYFGLVQLPEAVVVTISILTIIMVIFESTNKLSLKEFDDGSDGFKLTVAYFTLCLGIIAVVVAMLFSVSIPVALAFAIFAYGIDFAVLLNVFKKHKGYPTLKIESLINTPVAIILPLILLHAAGKSGFGSSLLILQQVFIGASVGLVIGFIVLSVLRHSYFGDLSYLAVVSAAVISYVVAELLRGNGVLAVALFGILFAHYRVEHKVELEKFTWVFSHILTILVFIITGTMLFIPAQYIASGTLLFIVYLFLRHASVHFFLGDFSLREKLFIAMNVPKGVGLAVGILLMASVFKSIPNISSVIYFGLLFLVYSIVLSAVANMFGLAALQIKKN